MTTVTAIISAYFAEPYLPGRLENLREQDCIVLAIAQKDSAEARVLKLDGVDTILTDGVPTIYEAWNMMIEKAQTPYITNANCDDRIYPNMYKKMADALDRRKDYAVCYGNIDMVKEYDGERQLIDTPEGGFDVLMNYCFPGPMPMWRRSLHDSYGLFNGELKVAGDYEFWLRIAKEGEKFYKLQGGPVGMYLNRPDSAEHREATRSLIESAKVRSPYIKRR
jgi:hypothetical protein